MQQTSKYKLNLIETSDRFSPDPLNENAEKLETQLAAEASARKSADTAETSARKSADTAEAKARADAIAAEAKTRADADTAETNARKAAITAEAKARADADAAETSARKSADTTETNARKAADTALDKRVKVLEARRIVTGSYTGTTAINTIGSYQNINLGFQPNLVIIFNPKYYITCMTAVGISFQGTAAITDTGFKVRNSEDTGAMNISGIKYLYLAIL